MADLPGVVYSWEYWDPKTPIEPRKFVRIDEETQKMKARIRSQRSYEKHRLAILQRRADKRGATDFVAGTRGRYSPAI